MGKKSEEKLGKKGKKEKQLKKAEKKSKKAARKMAARSPVTPDQRIEMIATAAYYIAERHGFTPGMSEADWRAAERQIDALLEKQN
jgi:hypothetical protein